MYETGGSLTFGGKFVLVLVAAIFLAYIDSRLISSGSTGKNISIALNWTIFAVVVIWIFRQLQRAWWALRLIHVRFMKKQTRPSEEEAG